MIDTVKQPEATFSFPANEHEILAFWQRHDIFNKTLQQSENKPIYAFYDGPPFATGLPHHGHLLASTLKDIIPRYFTMNGHYVPRRFGWDCHGLPIEYEIDKKFGKATHEVVAEIGVKGYNQACRDIVQRYASQWRSTITRMGRWVDFENDYKTMNISFMESVWWVFKQLWEKDLIYRGTKVVPYSTALATGLSNFEAGSNYQDVQDPAITVLLKLHDEDAFLAIWTTTPWTLPSNLGVCVNRAIDYVLVKDLTCDITFYLAAARLDAYQKNHDIEVIATVPGSELVGKSYEPLFPYFKHLHEEGAFQVFADDYVTTEDGTGLVHMAPAFGEDDARVMLQAGIKTLACPIDENGCFTDDVTDFSGQHVKEADKHIIKQLKETHHLYEHSTIMHSYPFCPRSDTPLIYRAIPSWYVHVTRIKDQLIAANQQINWVPAHLRDGRFGKWIAGARDWAVSRNRVWGTPLPIWINNISGKAYCVGSVHELEQLTQQTIKDLHRDHVDHLTFQLPNEEGSYERVTEVLDCWFESGSMPYAQLHYPFSHKDEFNHSFPAEFIAEGLDQTRGWFYTLNVLSVALFNKPAFKNVIVNGIVMAEDGKKMSKRLNNYTPPDRLMETYGADALRLYLIHSGLVKGEEQRFTDDGIKEMVRRTLLPWYNSFKFFQTYATIDQWQADTHFQSSQHILDQWILSRLQSLKAMIHRNMQAYKLYNVVPELLQFIEDLTNCYIRLNRSRFWGSGLDNDKCQAYSTLFTVIQELSTLMAPFTPFLAEYIYQQLKSFYSDTTTLKESVHLLAYPQSQAKLINQALEAAVERLDQILVLGRKKRNETKIKVKIPLQKLTIIHKDHDLLAEIHKLDAILKKELNVKEIRYASNENDYINLYAKPNSPVLGRRLGKKFAAMRQAIEQLNQQQIEQLERDGSIELLQETLSVDDILVFREAKAGTDTLTNRFIAIELDTTLTDELLAEGLARELVNRIQKMRKELNFNVDDRITIYYQADTHMSAIIKNHADYITHETLAIALLNQRRDDMQPIDIDSQTIQVTLIRER